MNQILHRHITKHFIWTSLRHCSIHRKYNSTTDNNLMVKHQTRILFTPNILSTADSSYTPTTGLSGLVISVPSPSLFGDRGLQPGLEAFLSLPPNPRNYSYAPPHLSEFVFPPNPNKQNQLSQSPNSVSTFREFISYIKFPIFIINQATDSQFVISYFFGGEGVVRLMKS